jgi:phytoene synthase
MSSVEPAPAEVLARHGKSFAWASRFLGRREADIAAETYAFCRRVDDLADDAPADEAVRALAALRAQLRGAAGPAGWVESFLSLAERIGLPVEVVDEFVAGIAHDTGSVRIADEVALVRYAYGVAGTVGLKMCAVFGVSDPRAFPFAIDLGVGMQLTNLCRDVLEDAGRDRVYLPGTALGEGVSPALLLSGDTRARARAERAIWRVLELADAYYRSADRGLRFLPRRARLSILVASRVYEAIGFEVRSGLRDGSYWSRRAFVSRSGKVWHTLRAVGSFLSRPLYWRLGPPPSHEPLLHEALVGLPGADPEA